MISGVKLRWQDEEMAGITCPCGVEMIINFDDSDDGNTCYECGRFHVLVSRIDTAEPIGRCELAACNAWLYERPGDRGQRRRYCSARHRNTVQKRLQRARKKGLAA